MEAPHLVSGSPALRQTAHKAAAKGGQDRESPRQSASSAGAALLTSQQAAREIFGVSLRTFNKIRQQPNFGAKPRVLGPKTVRWVREELQQVARSLPVQEEPNPLPEGLRRHIEAMKATGNATAAA